MRSRLWLLGLVLAAALLLFVFSQQGERRDTADARVRGSSEVELSQRGDPELSDVPSADDLAVPNSVQDRAALSEAISEASPKSSGELPETWRLVVRDANTRERIESGIELRYRDQTGEEQFLLIHSGDDLERMPAELRDRKISVAVYGYRPEKVKWRGKIQFKAVRLVRERELIVRFVDSGNSGREFASSLRLAKKVIRCGLAKPGGKPIERELETQTEVTVALTPPMAFGDASPVYERKFELRPLGDTELEIDFAEIPPFAVVDLRLQLEVQDPSFLSEDFWTRLYSSRPDGKPLAHLNHRGWELQGWKSDESSGDRELHIRKVPAGTYTLEFAEIGFLHTFKIWPEEEEHTERIAFPRLSQVTVAAVGIPEEESRMLDPVKRDALYWGYHSEEESLEFLEQAKLNRLSGEDLMRAHRKGLLRRAETIEVGQWTLTCIAGRSVWAVYSGYRKRQAEPLEWTPAGGRSELRLEVSGGK